MSNRKGCCSGAKLLGGMAVFRGDVIQDYSSPDLFAPAIHFRYELEQFWKLPNVVLSLRLLSSLTQERRVIFINPFVGVAYTQGHWRSLETFKRYERVFKYLQWIVSKIEYPEYHPRRPHDPGQLVTQKDMGAVPQLVAIIGPLNV